MDRFSNDGLTFGVLDAGPADGEPVVLLHGFPERAGSWELVAPLLHARGYRTLAPDQRGYSPGARPGRRRDYAARALAGDVRALIAAVGGPVHLVGHDWGAVVAWYVAANHPQDVRTLTALSVPHPAAYLRSLLGPQGPRSWYMLLFNVPRLPERLAARPGGFMERLLQRSGATPDEVARFRREIVADGALTGGLNWYRAMALGMNDTPGAVTVPTTHVWSDRDFFVHRAGPLRTGRHCTGPYAFVELPGVSHWIPTHAPEAAAEAILARIGAPAMAPA